MEVRQVGGQPDEGDVDLAVVQGGGLAAPVEALGLDADAGVGAGELGAGPGGEVTGAAGFEAHAQDACLCAPVPVGGGRDAVGLAEVRRDSAITSPYDGGGGDAHGVPVEQADA